MFTLPKHRDPEYREYVAKLVVEEHRVARQVAFELELPESTVNHWVAAYKKKKLGPDQGKYVTPGELSKLEAKYAKEIKALREENEILKKAMHIFTKGQ